MISIVAGLLLQGAQPEYRAVPPPPPPPPPPGRVTPRPARANLGALVSPEDYPAEAVAKGEEGAVGFRLEVGANGRVTGCTIIQSSGSASLDSATCRLMQARARFTPAIDSRGRPTADSVASRLVWRLPEDLAPMESRWLVGTMRASPAGAIECTITVNNRAVSPVTCNPPPSLAQEARASGRWAQETYFEMIIVEGRQPPPMNPVSWGEPLTATEAKLRVAADGSILGCRPRRHEQLEAGKRRRILAPDPCKAWPTGSRKFEPGPEGGAARDVTVVKELYRR
jgi:TonB family protein